MEPTSERHPPNASPPPRTRTARAPDGKLALRLIAALVLVAALLGVQRAAAQVVVDPQSIVVNPAPAFEVQVSLDRDPRGNDVPVYRLGESVTITVRVDRTAYVYLFDVRPDGRVTQILPNRLSGGQSNRIQAGRSVTFPPQGAPYQFQIDGPTGVSKVIAVASTEQLDTDTLASFRSGAQFATSDIGEEGFADAFSIVVRPVEQSEWVTDTALYRVGQPGSSGPAPAPGGQVVWDAPTVRLPSGAELIRLDRNNRNSRVDFRIGIGLDTLYDRFDRQIRDAGWRRTEVRTRSGEIRAEYRGGGRIELRLEREGSDRYELRIQRRGGGDDDDDDD